MTDANVRDETIMRELKDLFVSDIDETREEQESFSFHEEAATDDIPPSLISYFETSKSRAAVCEKFILEEPEDFTTSYEDVMNLPVELSREMVTLNEQGVSETGNENSTSTDSCLLPAPTETEPLVTHNVTVCPNNEDETETDEHMENEKHLTSKLSDPKTSVTEKEIKETSEYQREHTEKQHFEEMKKEEQIRQREKDFQEELKKLMETEKLHQTELQLMEKRAQEKLEQELLLQQELISNLQKQVEKDRRRMEEEVKRIKEEEKKKREEEKIKRQLQLERMEEEMRKAKAEEENRKIKEKKAEELRNKEEEQRKKKEEEEKRRREEKEKNKMEKEMRKKEEERKIDERKNEIRLEEEEKRRQMEEEERKNKEKEDKIKEKKKNEEREEEEETMKREQEKTVTEVTGKKMEGDKKRKNEEEIIFKDDWQKEEGKTRVEDKKKEEEVRMTKELERRTQQEEKKEGERKSEEERKKAEIEKMMDEQVKKKEEENRKIGDEMQPSQDKEKRNKDVERRHSIEYKCIRKEEEKITKEDEWKKGHKEEIRQTEEKDIIQINTELQKYSKMEEEMRLKEKEGNKTYGAEIRQVDSERKAKEKERKHEQKRKKLEKGEGGGKNTEADEWQMKEEVSEYKEGTIKTEERRLKEEEESKMIIVQETEKEARLERANELQEKKQENNSMSTQNERRNRGSTGHSLTSQLEDNSTWTSLGPGPSHSDSTSFESVQQGDQDKDISESYINRTIDQQDPAAKMCTSPSSLLLCLPEHTEQKRLSWMKDCVPWSKLSLQNRRKQKVSVQTQRFLRRDAEASGLPPLCSDTLLQSTGCKSLQEVTTVTLEDLPGCNLSSLVHCTQLRSLTLRRCGLKSLEGISQLSELCYIDVEENKISFVNCENMTSLRVLRLGHNKLTSIHGLSGTDNLDVLELSHNNITRVAGLESKRRLQRLSVDHNQLISTKGLRDVYTLLHLNCSHNHLASVEGLENSALLNTLDVTANSLTEPPSLDNHVLLRELRLDDNSISSLQGLSACWLPLLQHLSVAQNRITQLPSMSDFVSLANLDLRFNCMSELQNVCDSLEGCQFLQNIHLTGNPLQQESGWRSTLQRALPGLKAIDDQDTDFFLSPPTLHQISFASVSFLAFCQAQFQQINDLQQQHNRELSKASSSLDAVRSFCQHFTETLKLAEEQRFAHEYGDTTVSAGQTAPEETAAMERTNAEEFTGNSQKVSPADISIRNDIKCSYWTFEEKSSTESWPHTLDTVKTIPKTGLHSLTTRENASPFNIKTAALSNHQDLDLKNTAAVVIQQQWTKYRQKCRNINGPPAAEKEGRSGENPKSGPFYINGSVVDQHYAATVIQAFWKGCSVRRRLASALAAVTCPGSREDDTFEEVDVDEFVFDEAALEKHWTLQLSEDFSSRHDPVSEQPLSLKFPGPFADPSQYGLPPPPVWRPKQAWVAGEEVHSAGQRVSPESSHRKSPASTSVLSGISERSEKILEEWGFTDSHTALLMLKRAQKMKSKQQPKKKHGDPSVRLALFRNCHYKLGPVEAQNRPSPHSRNYKKVCKAELGLQQAEEMEQMKQEGAQQWLHTQSDRSTESEHFLPEISSDILNGGRVQLVCVQADPTYTERHHTSGLWANNRLAAQPNKQNSSPHRISLGHARKGVPSPKRVTSAPSKKERISFRDNPVQLSGGWGGGKKREKVHK